MRIHITVKRIVFLSLITGLIASLVPSSSISAITPGGGWLLYGQGTLTTPMIRQRQGAGATWTGEFALASTTTIPRQTIVKASPTNNEVIAGVVTSGGVLNILKWNGYTWSSQWTTTTALGNLPRFDIAYEQNSGQAVVMYSKNVATTNELAYRVWQPSTGTWTSEAVYNAARTSGIIHGVQLASRAGSDDIGVAWADANRDLSANWWDGSANTWGTEPAAALSTGLTVIGAATTIGVTSFDIAFEQTSGDMMVAWGNNAVTDMLQVVRAAGSGGAWGSTATNTAFVTEPTDMRLAAEPGTDYIGYVNSAIDTSTSTEAAIWNGSSWGPLSTIDTTSDTVAAATRNSSITWVQNGAQSRAVVTYDDTNAAGVDWTVYNKNTNTWALQTDFATAPAPAALNDVQHLLITNPADRSKALLFITDQNLDLFAKQLSFDGTNFTWSSTEPGAVALETGVPNAAAGWIAGYDFVTAATTSLSTDIVDANDASVASPSVSFSAVTSSPSCQTSTGTLGSASQKIRVSNFTTTPGWTLSLAATGGSTANWSNGIGSYDFNDITSSGCGEGGDSDGLPGRLTVDASASTLAAEQTCAATNVTKGSSSSFNEGTVNSVTLLNAAASANSDCYFDLTNVALSQTIPDILPAGTYSLNLTLTTVAN